MINLREFYSYPTDNGSRQAAGELKAPVMTGSGAIQPWEREQSNAYSCPKADPHLRHFWARGPWGPNAYGSPSSPSGCGTAAVSCRRFSADFAKQLERVAQDYDVLADPLGFGRDGKQRVRGRLYPSLSTG